MESDKKTLSENPHKALDVSVTAYRIYVLNHEFGAHIDFRNLEDGNHRLGNPNHISDAEAWVYLGNNGESGKDESDLIIKAMQAAIKFLEEN